MDNISVLSLQSQVHYDPNTGPAYIYQQVTDNAKIIELKQAFQKKNMSS